MADSPVRCRRLKWECHHRDPFSKYGCEHEDRECAKRNSQPEPAEWNKGEYRPA